MGRWVVASLLAYFCPPSANTLLPLLGLVDVIHQLCGGLRAAPWSVGRRWLERCFPALCLLMGYPYAQAGHPGDLHLPKPLSHTRLRPIGLQ